MTIVSVERDTPKRVRTNRHSLEAGQYYLDASPNACEEIYIVIENLEGEFALIDVQDGSLYGGFEGMSGDDADFVLLSDVKVQYTE